MIYFYLNTIKKGDNSKNQRRVVKALEIEELLNRVTTNQPLNYGDTVLNELMHYFSPLLANKSLAVIGTQIPWIEAIGLVVGHSRIVTLDYTRATYEYPKLKWLHVNDYLDNAINNTILEEFDTIASFSSLEHSGLGRYGDPINPNGDIEAVKQIHCMLKPGGLFFLGLPTNDDGSSHIEFNAHRVYGTARFEVMFEGWRYLIKKKASDGFHSVFVLQKL
jgi:SAM-dependent methyltransferase